MRMPFRSSLKEVAQLQSMLSTSHTQIKATGAVLAILNLEIIIFMASMFRKIWKKHIGIIHVLLNSKIVKVVKDTYKRKGTLTWDGWILKV